MTAYISSLIMTISASEQFNAVLLFYCLVQFGVLYADSLVKLRG